MSLTHFGDQIARVIHMTKTASTQQERIAAEKAWVELVHREGLREEVDKL